MAADTKRRALIDRVDRTLATWRQGDCVVGEEWFALRIDPGGPLSPEAQKAAGEEVELIETSVRGLVVVTQTCDVVRSCTERPFVEVCPLVEIDADTLAQVERARRPRFALVPGTRDQRLVADLDRTMTLEKMIVAQWTRTAGLDTDAEARSFAQALARKRARPALPDDFNQLTRKFTGRMTGKHEKNSDEGRALRALREIRVQASPSWDATAVELFFWFIRDGSDPTFEGKEWRTFLETWLGLVPAGGRFTDVSGLVATLEELNAAEYVASDLLDLDHLSVSE